MRSRTSNPEFYGNSAVDSFKFFLSYASFTSFVSCMCDTYVGAWYFIQYSGIDSFYDWSYRHSKFSTFSSSICSFDLSR